jgi:hypothetical protein
MHLHVMHDARMMARLANATPPACDALACRLGRPDQVSAAWVEGNPLAPGWLAAADGPGPRLLCWSGSLAGELFDSHPHNWMRPGRAALDALVMQAAPALDRQGRSLCLRPHLRHVLSDAQGCLRFLADHAGMPVQIALSPADMISVDMLRDLPEHLERLFATLGPRAAVVLLQDIGPMEADAPPNPCPLGEGSLPRDLVRRLLADHVPHETPVILQPERLEAQLAWLGVQA